VLESGSSSKSDAVVMRVTTADGQITTTTTTTATTTTATTVQTSAGSTVRTDASGTVPTATNELVVAITTPVGGTVALAKHDGTAATGFRPLTGIDVTAPTATVDDPLELTMSMYADLLPDGFPLGSVTVLKDGVAVADCETTVSATPDPCIASRTLSGTTVTLTILTSSASDWTLAVEPLQRLSGDDRILSAIAASQSAFTDGSAEAVVLARSDGFADALAATPLAARKGGPLLLTGSSGLDDRVLEEIVRVLPAGGTVYLLGGTGALSTAVETRLASWGFARTRYAGADRYATAVKVAVDGLDSPDTVIETTGLAFADALAAGAVAAHLDAAVLLTAGATQSASTAAYLAAMSPTRYAIGGPAAAADPGATSIVGTDRYETAVLAAIEFFESPDILGFASGADFPDALGGGTHVAHAGGPLLLVPTTGSLPVPLTIYLADVAAEEPAAFLYGGTSAVDATIEGLLETALGA
jgi:putative cell wall-binding protein